MTISSEIDERTLRELYLVPFEAAVTDAGVRSIMTAYNRLNGTYCSEHPWLITERAARRVGLRRRRHQRLVRHPQRGRVVARRTRPRDARTAARARRRAAAPRVDAGEVRERELDPPWPGCWRSARGPAPATTGTDEVTADDPATRDVIRRAAARAMVLLKNDGDLLPLAT